MIRNLRFTLLAAAFVALVSCADKAQEAVPADACGILDLASMEVSPVEAELTTRAVPTDGFIVRVWDKHDALAGEWTLSELRLEQPLTLKVGDYRLEVCSEDLSQDADWETPWYFGSTTFTIVRDQVTTVGPVVCTLGNVKVTVRYSEGLQQPGLMESAQATITIGEGTLVYGMNESQAGYFKTTGETCDMTVSLTARIEGVTDTYTNVISGVRAGEWHMVRFAYEEAEGSRTYYIYVGEFLIGQITPGTGWGILN